ncbi:methionine sulfoxide reductase catalytic subunit [Bathymodiolus platifrons methanotrophic gill symbiont]|uniref:protein-methionine-sulfoxide reductase catalytic subunit MsrP n=1 Tax=Bathymodiolus platifrons methanotrophic gill symbiont TaxID=113268 RepID=UPI0011C6F677|nr:protein-methionine-sulfoxide reductase catalytic subunit MsrP [Bathymodiolus platifrons methanotrophic gill symbiont]MCK5869812.1 protein-methionine-sulfoxide reductase catalytic subunit MsrP [Methyloprofundus sp.]TXK95997.1 mononuclear molybdenum enzyme YedY [Methylococcaceae bacterium CS4]TXL05416.1 mononuclear molybdenum enzyme YedY [Methylococcaceae bacterium CS1]TXL10181.1 mononuclear molybdenum enzyme YedY [Methylococcaceae bacterium CS2]GFO74612.1 methionine sulfoxide reductase catal
MLIKEKTPILSSEITDKAIFINRRKIIKAAAGISIASLLPGSVNAQEKKYAHIPAGPYSASLKVTDYEDAANYTNYYEFSTNKKDSTVLAKNLKTIPWNVTVEGEAEKTGVFNLEDILKNNSLEERIYRFRCVEAWSMAAPWIGFPLGAMLKQFQPSSKAKFVKFTTLYDPEVMIGQKTKALGWPYVEGLRMDEAMHPLAFMATGMYDDTLPNQNGAPLRLVIPWKYGFKSIKAIVKIRFTETMPATAWNKMAPGEYGFYANVNPAVAHPRWSQSRERILGASIFTPKRKTEMFNGYEEQVASLYSGMDLKKYF